MQLGGSPDTHSFNECFIYRFQCIHAELHLKLVWKILFLYVHLKFSIHCLVKCNHAGALAIKSIPLTNLKLFSDPLDRQVNEPLLKSALSPSSPSLGHIFGSPRKV